MQLHKISKQRGVRLSANAKRHIRRLKQQKRRERKKGMYRLHTGTPRKSQLLHQWVDLPTKVLFPEVMDVIANTEGMLDFLDRIRFLVLVQGEKRIEVDHTPLKMITPEAVTVLMAEFHRITALSTNLVLITRQTSIQPAIKEILGQTGYLRHFGIEWQGQQVTNDVVIDHVSASRTLTEVSGRLVERFAADPCFPQEAVKPIGRAIGECMENTVLHAYPRRDQGRQNREVLDMRWWLLGMHDRKNHKFFFVLYDQGVGIPNTIRTRTRDKIRLPFLARTNEQLVRIAIEEGAFSSTQDPNRGRGLRTLKTYVDRSAAGELIVITNKIFLKYRNQNEVEAKRLSKSLQGTLILWSIQP